MRNDAGVDGDAQRISQMTWMFFLKVYDAKEQLWELNDENYKSIIPENLRWSNWAIDEKERQKREDFFAKDLSKFHEQFAHTNCEGEPLKDD